MAKKDKKSKTSEQKARLIAKQSKKAAKGEKKAKFKDKDADSDADDNVDLDSVLAAYAEEQAKFVKVTEQACQFPPTARSSSTILASPSNRNELFVFGGEYFDGVAATFYNDLFVYLIDRSEWRQITSPNSPLPRSGHAWCRGGNAGGIYLFGGEFSSPKQGTFYHYNDFWHLDTGSREWTRLESRNKGKSPPARSGHRMTYFKNYIILFGGFQDTSQQTKYLQDLWIYDCRDNLWHESKLPAHAQKPDARSSFSFLPHDSGAVIYGGYSRVKAQVGTTKSGKTGAMRNILKPMIHQDTWFLRITPPLDGAATGTPPTIRWERRKRPANAPNPIRAGCTMAHHKGRGIMFGGVHDVEETEDGIESEFFNDLFAWNVDRNRFFPLTLRRPKAQGKKPATNVRNRDRGKADEEELLKNLAALEAKGATDDGDEMEISTPQSLSKEVPPPKDLLVRYELPHRRFNAQLTVQDDILFIFSGTFERGDMEFTFADMYNIDLGKLDGVCEIFNQEPRDWNAQSKESDDEDEEDEDEEMSDLSDEDEEQDTMSIDTPSTTHTDVSTLPTEAEAVTETEPEVSVERDPRPFPRPFESLRDFFTRTSNDWQRMIMALPGPQSAELSVKDLRKKAFDQAEERWWDCREEVRALEDEQEAAGIGEVVSVADRAGEGAGRRR